MTAAQQLLVARDMAGRDLCKEAGLGGEIARHAGQLWEGAKGLVGAGKALAPGAEAASRVGQGVLPAGWKAVKGVGAAAENLAAPAVSGAEHALPNAVSWTANTANEGEQAATHFNWSAAPTPPPLPAASTATGAVNAARTGLGGLWDSVKGKPGLLGSNRFIKGFNLANIVGAGAGTFMGIDRTRELENAGNMGAAQAAAEYAKRPITDKLMAAFASPTQLADTFDKERPEAAGYFRHLNALHRDPNWWDKTKGVIGGPPQA